MTYLYSQYLDKEFLAHRSRLTGYDPPDIEKFVMNFETHAAISKTVCSVAHGGVAASLFHGGSRRSEDIDLYSYEPVQAVKDAMSKFNSSQSEFYASLVRTSRLNPVPLVRYNVSYASAVAEDAGKIQMDFVCDPNRPKMPEKTCGAGIPVFGFETQHDILSLDLGALIADKLSALDLGRAGYRTVDNKNIPRQIYDISGLLDASSEHDMAQAASTFSLLTDHKIGYRKASLGNYSSLDSLVNSEKYLQSFFLPHNALSLGSHPTSLFQSYFKPLYLKDANYSKADYISSILLVMIFINILILHLEGKIEADEAAKNYAKVRTASKSPDIEKNALLKNWPRSSKVYYKSLRGSDSAKIYLLYQLESLRHARS